jgi:hypothetical protein
MGRHYSTEFLRKPFESVGHRNPLKQLSDSEKRLLIAMLNLHLFSSEDDDVFQPFEDVAAIAAEAGALSKKIQANVLGGVAGRILAPFLGSIQDLPARLEDFAKQIGTLLDDTVGKAGHKARVAKNQYLVMASEFVQATTREN